jgi:predicted RNA-binding protein YlqC (UPF0109 family)
VVGRAHVTPEQFPEWVRQIVVAIVQTPSALKVAGVYRSDTRLVLQMSVAPDDRGRVIGKGGETIKGLRAVIAAAGGHYGFQIALDLTEEAQRG